MQKDVVIYKQAAIDTVKAMEDKSGKGEIAGFYNVILERVIDKLNDLPSAQPEIVRCKNCVNWIPGHITEHDDFIPPKCGKYQQMVGHSNDDYCSFAERITDA